MVTDVKQLIQACTTELIDRQYKKNYFEEIRANWEDFSLWLSEQQQKFSVDAANQYCDIKIGTHILVPGMSLKEKGLLRSIRMLVSYQQNGEFEFRSPQTERIFSGNKGSLILDFFDYSSTTLNRASTTIDEYSRALYHLLEYMEKNNLEFYAITIDLLQDFLNLNCSTIGVRHSYSNSLRQFFRYLYAKNYTEIDLSLFVLPDNFNRHSNIPTTYSEDEVRRIIDGPDRSSAIGKRDYLVLLLAGEYGWRSADITGFRLDQIDWDKNVIRFDQQKTGNPIEFPLLSSVGNAIIDYIKHGRPVSDCPEVILSADSSKKIGPLSSPTIHSIVSRYMKKANITGWKEKKHGAHSLRHSLASNLLKRNTSLPVISTVLGHQTTETTKIYLRVDIDQLKHCCIRMPELTSPYYKKGGE